MHRAVPSPTHRPLTPAPPPAPPPRLSRLPALLAALLVLAVVLGGCATAGPRFGPDIQRSFVDYDMRRMETERLVLYYPAHRHEQAAELASHLQMCVDVLHGRLVGQRERRKITVVVPEVEFNNAYVALRAIGNPTHMVVPSYFTADLFIEMGMPPDPTFISCHEAVHYVQAEEIYGVPGFANTLFGHVYTPQLGLDPWFWEGLATWYETRLNPGTGRMASSYWRQTFASGFSHRTPGGGDLHAAQREIPFGGQYLVGAHFIEYLAETYGEHRLWQVVHSQASSIVLVFGQNLRFSSVYGKSLSALIDEFADHVRRTNPPRARPADQHTLEHPKTGRRAGRTVRFVGAPDGTRARIWSDLDRVARLSIHDANGRLVRERLLPDLLPGRTLVTAGLFSGLSFTADARALYFTAYDLDTVYWRTRLMRYDLAEDRLTIVHPDLRGAGGDLSPDGRRYVYPRAAGDRFELAAVDLETGRIETLLAPPSGVYLHGPRHSPDGRHIAAAAIEQGHHGLWLLDARTGRRLATLSEGPGEHREPVWIDADRLLFVREHDERLQVFAHALSTGATVQVTQAPYLAVNPWPAAGGDRVRFLNREQWHWTLDEVALPPMTAAVSNDDGANDAVTGNDTASRDDTSSRNDTAPLPPLRPARILDDRPYSRFDGLLVPRLHVPYAGLGFEYRPARDETLLNWTLGLDLSGLDTLGFHSWALSVVYETSPELVSAAARYVNAQLAPWYLYFDVAQQWARPALREWQTDEGVPAIEYGPGERLRLASVQAFRLFWDVPLLLGFLGTEIHRPDEAVPTRRFVGPQLATEYLAARSTAYGGPRSLLGTSLSAAVFPAELGSDFTLADTRLEAAVHLPLPLSERHRLRLAARGRGLFGVPDGARLLRVGGGAPVIASTQRSRTQPVDDDLLPPTLGFAEALRGYETLRLATNQAVLVDLNYRYPLIVDLGTATTLWLLPATFLQQIDFELFASGAHLFDGRTRGAVGASVDINFYFWLVPLQLRYQVARRVFDDHALVHTVLLGL